MLQTKISSIRENAFLFIFFLFVFLPSNSKTYYKKRWNVSIKSDPDSILRNWFALFNVYILGNIFFSFCFKFFYKKICIFIKIGKLEWKTNALLLVTSSFSYTHYIGCHHYYFKRCHQPILPKEMNGFDKNMTYIIS